MAIDAYEIRLGKVFSTDKSVWMQGRCAWMFAYLCHVYGVKDEWLERSEEHTSELQSPT